MFSFEVEGFCSLGVLWGGLGISKLQVLIKNIYKNSSYKFFFQFLAIKTPDLELDPDPNPHWIWIRICN